MLEARIYHRESDEYSGSFPIDAYGGGFETVAKSTKPCNYLTFDGNGINLIDNNLKFYEDGDFLGYMFPYKSSATKSENSDYPIEQSRPLVFDFNGVVEKPKNITIFCKDASVSSSKAVISYVRDNQATQTIKFPQHVDNKIVLKLPDNVTYVEYYISSTLAPNQYIVVSSVFYGTVEVYNQFKNSGLCEEINILSDDLSINQFEATIIVPEGASVKFAKKDPLALINNHRYYGTFYITDVQRAAKNLYEITAQDVLTIYDNSNFENWQPDIRNKAVRVADIVTEIENQTKLKLDTSGINTSESIVGNKKDGNCRLALCELGYCLKRMIDTSRRDNVVFKTIPSTITSQILTSSNRILGDATFRIRDEISSAEIYRTKIEGIDNTAAKTQTVTGNVGDIITLTFSTPTYFEEDFATSSGVEFLAYTLYSCKVKLTETTGVVTYYPRTITENIVTITNPNATINNVQKFQNITLKPLTVNLSNADNVEKYIKSRGTVNAKIRLRGEKVGDLIQIETAWDGIITGIITKMDIAFGYEDIADIEVLEWSI